MADANDQRHRDGEALLRQLRRLEARARVAKSDDRAELIALIDDAETLQRRLRGECARLDEEMKQGAIRTAAIRAYMRGARSVRAVGPRRM